MEFSFFRIHGFGEGIHKSHLGWVRHVSIGYVLQSIQFLICVWSGRLRKRDIGSLVLSCCDEDVCRGRYLGLMVSGYVYTSGSQFSEFLTFLAMISWVFLVECSFMERFIVLAILLLKD